MKLIPFGRYAPDIDDLDGGTTRELSNVLPRADGWGPASDLQRYSQPPEYGNDDFTKVLLHFDGQDGATSISDDAKGATGQHGWSAAGNASIDDAQWKFGGASLLCDGTGDYVSCPDHTDFDLGDGDWTIDLWFRCNVASGSPAYIAGQQDSSGTASSLSFFIQRSTSDVIRCDVRGESATVSLTSTTQFTSSTNTGWHHLALVRSGDDLMLFIDGKLEDSDTISGAINDSSSALAVGRGGEITDATWNGWIDEFRISVGIARYVEEFNVPLAPYADPDTGQIRGIFSSRRTDGTIAIFCGTAKRLYILDNSTLQWRDVSKDGIEYAEVPGTDNWTFAQFANHVVACQANVTPQLYALGSDDRFDDLGGSPPPSKFVSVVGRFLVLSGQTNDPLKVSWSALSDITEWTPGTNFSGSFEAPDGGVVLGCAGGEYGLVFQESVIRRMTYRPGAVPAFEFERVTEDFGLMSGYAIARSGPRIFFVTQQGFAEYNRANGLRLIGKEIVDRTILAEVDLGRLNLLQAAADPAATRVAFAYKSIGSSVDTSWDRVIIYDYGLERWSPPLTISGESLASIVKPGLTLEALDATSHSLDDLPFSLDSVSSAVGSELAGVTTSHCLGFFDGGNLEAIVETAEQSMDGGRWMFLRGFYPRTDAEVVFGSVRHRARPNDVLLQSGESDMNDEGLCPQAIEVRLVRGRCRIPAGENWSYIRGIEPDAQMTGMR